VKEIELFCTFKVGDSVELGPFNRRSILGRKWDFGTVTAGLTRSLVALVPVKRVTSAMVAGLRGEPAVTYKGATCPWSKRSWYGGSRLPGNRCECGYVSGPSAAAGGGPATGMGSRHAERSNSLLRRNTSKEKPRAWAARAISPKCNA